MKLWYLPRAFVGLVVCTLTIATAALAQDTSAGTRLTVRVDQPGARISPSLYGLMTEEINHSYDGGLYAEQIQNRTFQDDALEPIHWSVVQGMGAAGTIAIDTANPVNTNALPRSLRLDITAATRDHRVGVANDGFWGIAVQPNTRYHASFYARAAAAFKGPLTVDLESADGGTIYVSATVPHVGALWQKYDVVLTTKQATSSSDTRFVISTHARGTVWFSLVSLFPPTYHDRPNGNRVDLMQRLADLHPAFLRFPGGNYLEGDSLAGRFDWKKTIGPLEDRPGHEGPWGYRSSDGLGLLEFFVWCEDLHMEPVLAVFGGLTLNRQHVTSGPALAPYVQDALDEIEYATGDAHSTWGQRRAKDGHPAPFSLRYVEISNEDDGSSYDARFAQFYDAIKTKYPALQIIATAPLRSRTPDVIDEHYYESSASMKREAVDHFDHYVRTGPKIFVGEWATVEGSPTPTLQAALADAAWLTDLERNADLVIMSCYAPLLVNVNPGAAQWRTNLIGYDAIHSYGSPSYYAQRMFMTHRGDIMLPTVLTQPQGPPTLFTTASRDQATGNIILKIVNAGGTSQALPIDLTGAPTVVAHAMVEVMTGQPSDVNSVSEPEHVAPKRADIENAGPSFVYTAPAYSVSVMVLTTK